MSQVCIVSVHTSQFRRANLIFKSIEFSRLGSRYIWIAITYHLREFDASCPIFDVNTPTDLGDELGIYSWALPSLFFGYPRVGFDIRTSEATECS